MFDSLVLGNSIELLNGGVTSINPLCYGAKFQLQPGSNPGAPQPTTDYVAGLLLDGERPFGRRASNRTITLPIWITAPNRQILAAAREFLQQVIDQDYFTVTWTRDPTSGNPGNVPLPLLLDCFRAQPTVPVFNTLLEKQLCGMQIQITIPALPYGRSATQAQISFTAPVPVGPPVPPPPVSIVLDNYQTISSTQCSQSTCCVVGPYTCCWDPDSFGDPGGQNTPLTYSTTFPAPLNLANMTALQFWLGLGSRYYSCLEYPGKTHGVGVYITLTDSSGNTLAFARSNLILPVAQYAQSPVFTKIVLHVPPGSTSFNYASVAGYSIEITNRHDFTRRLSWVTAYLDALTALAGGQVVNPVTRGAIFTLSGLLGTARAPASMSFQQAPTAGSPTTITTAGSGTYTVPAGTAWLKVEAWGGGGSGAQMTTAGMGPGGGGAEYAAETIFPAVAGQGIPYTVGAGDTSPSTLGGGLASVFGPGPSSTLQVIANGGGSPVTNGVVPGAGGSGSLNAVEHPGGAGRVNPAGTFGGGGGSSGGTTAAGATPIGSGSVLFTSPGTFSGGSGWLCPAGVFQVLAEAWGAGGGAGSGSNSSSGSNGAGGGGGEYRNGLVPVTPGTHYTIVVGAGGAGGFNQANGSAGGLSSFTGDSGNQVLANPGQGGIGNSWYSTTAAGGTGGIGTFARSGGAGGQAYPYTGGGGSSGSPSGYGNAGWSSGGATAPTGGGNGGYGTGSNTGGNGNPGQAPGGGGGGSHAASTTGGAGGAGQVRLTYPASTGAPTSAGGIAVSGGGAGGAGGATSNTTGSAGSAPGGGGGGADSSGTTEAGGAGAAGQIKVTPYVPAAFKTLIVHRPPLGTLKTFQPLVSVGGGADPPDGTHQYTMPQPVTGVNSDFSGTYTIYLINSSWTGGSGSTSTRVIYVTVTQYEYAGGPGYPVSTLPVTVSPSQVTNGIVVAGVLTLPVKAVAPDNLGGYYSVSVTDTQTGDRFWDCLFLDTMGQLVCVNRSGVGYITYYIDAPDPNVSIGRIMGSQLGRPDAISVMDACQAISGGPLYVEPADGDNMLFVYSADANAPNVSLTYSPAYFFDRTQ